MKPPEYDAELRNYALADKRLAGYIFNDKKGRFYEGQYVLTSTVGEITRADDGFEYATTRNSVYKLIKGD